MQRFYAKNKSEVEGPGVHSGVFVLLKSWSLRATIAPFVMAIFDRIMDCRLHACSLYDDEVKIPIGGTARHRGDSISSVASVADSKLKASSEESEYTSSIAFWCIPFISAPSNIDEHSNEQPSRPSRRSPRRAWRIVKVCLVDSRFLSWMASNPQLARQRPCYNLTCLRTMFPGMGRSIVHSCPFIVRKAVLVTFSKMSASQKTHDTWSHKTSSLQYVVGNGHFSLVIHISTASSTTSWQL